MISVQDLVNLIKASTVHNWVYHFTDAENFQSIIKSGGLFSKAELERKGIAPPRPGGNQWSHDADAAKGLSDYVNLCLTRNHPMCKVAEREERLVDPRYLGISPEVLLLPGVKFTLDVANKRGVELFDLEGHVSSIDLEVLYERTNWKDPAVLARLRAAEKFEILVPKNIPLDMIKRKF